MQAPLAGADSSIGPVAHNISDHSLQLSLVYFDLSSRLWNSSSPLPTYFHYTSVMTSSAGAMAPDQNDISFTASSVLFSNILTASVEWMIHPALYQDTVLCVFKGMAARQKTLILSHSYPQWHQIKSSQISLNIEPSILAFTSLMSVSFFKGLSA